MLSAADDVPPTMRAVVTTGDGHVELKRIDTPRCQSGEALVKVIAVAQNPTDWKTAVSCKARGNVLGCDFAGLIVEIGPDVPSGLRTIGQRVAGLTHGGIGPNGAFSEYVTVPAALTIVLPDRTSFEDAAQIPVACFTTCQALYQCLHLPTPLGGEHEQESVLIWSGSSATGYYAVQFAKLAGLHVITTSSPSNFKLMKDIGADEVYDYAPSHTPRRIFASTDGKLKHAMDCISQDRTPNQVSTALSKDGGTIATLLPYVSRTKGVRTEFILAYSIFGKAITVPFMYPAKQDHYDNAVKYAALISEVLHKHEVKPIPSKLFPHGLESVKDGFEYMQAGKVHGEKVTYRIADTPEL